MSKSDHRTCNRRPFLSEEGCDRGSVDIYQFDDFPYCETVDPTMPAIPPEIVDSPLQIPVPPSCACVNIKYALKLKYSKDRKFGAEASFSAQGDCCEGNYVSNFDLQIPCPILGKGSKKFKLKIGYGSGKASAAASYIRTNPDSCTVEANDVDIRLDIPCPVKDSRGKKIKIGISYGEGDKVASASFIRTDPKGCEIEPLSPDIHLNLPCPIVGRKDAPKIKASIKYGSGDGKASASYIKADPKECTIEPLSPSLELDIPCPIKDSRGKKIKIGISYGNGNKTASASFLVTDAKNCTVEALAPTFNLNLPCPVRRQQNTPKIKAKIGWGTSGASASASLLSVNVSSCEIQARDVNLNLNIPCPIKGNGAKYIKIGNQKIEFVKFSNSTCEMSFGDASFDIDVDVPCPISPQGDRKITFGALNFGEPTQVSSRIANLTNCMISMDEPRFDLNVPCALKGLEIEKGTIKTEGSKGDIEIRKRVIPSNTSCSETFEIGVTFPKGGTSIEKEVVTDMKYEGHTLKIELTKFENGTSKSRWKTVFTAVSHKSDHVCCNDA